MFKEGYSLTENEDFLYNYVSCLYLLKSYYKILEMPDSVYKKSEDFYTLYLFSALEYDKSLLKDVDLSAITDIETRFVFTYWYNKELLDEKSFEKLMEEYALTEYHCALIADILSVNKSSTEKNERLLKKIEEKCRCDETIKAFHKIIKSKSLKNKIISSNNKFYPVLREHCGYYGCPTHSTNWEL